MIANLFDISLLPNSSYDLLLVHFERLMIGGHVGPIPDPEVIPDSIRMVQTWTQNLVHLTQTFQVCFEIVLFELFENSMEMPPGMMIAKSVFYSMKIPGLQRKMTLYFTKLLYFR